MRISILLLVALLLGCTDDVEPADERTRTYSAQDARAAVIEYIRTHPDDFVGPPDPDRLEAEALTEYDDGNYGFGIVVVNPEKGTFSAYVGSESPEPYLYEGQLVPAGGKLKALPPKVTRFHNPDVDVPVANTSSLEPAEETIVIRVFPDGTKTVDGKSVTERQLVDTLLQFSEPEKVAIIVETGSEVRLGLVTPVTQVIDAAVPNHRPVTFKVVD